MDDKEYGRYNSRIEIYNLRVLFASRRVNLIYFTQYH